MLENGDSKMRMLRTVFYKVGKEHQDQMAQLAGELAQEGVICRQCGMQQLEKIFLYGNPGHQESGWQKHILVLTDDISLSQCAAAHGIACIGVGGSSQKAALEEQPPLGRAERRQEAGQQLCSRAEAPFFEGAGLVVLDLEGLDLQFLEAYLLRVLGLPVTIARTRRLILRDITPEDLDTLYRISCQEGMQYAVLGENGENCFEPERMAAYIQHQYRLYGYGLWSVVLVEDCEEPGQDEYVDECEAYGPVIGCCGFALPEKLLRGARPLVLKLDLGGGRDSQNTEPLFCLEMEYMLDEAYRGQGLGIDMCQAAIAYARDSLAADRLLVQVHPANLRALAFAQRLGFLPAAPDPLWHTGACPFLI